MPWRPSCWATATVVPEPMNGSRTVAGVRGRRCWRSQVGDASRLAAVCALGRYCYATPIYIRILAAFAGGLPADGLAFRHMTHLSASRTVEIFPLLAHSPTRCSDLLILGQSFQLPSA